MGDISKGQRALWTFLMFTLVAPFIAAVVVATVAGLAGPLGYAARLPSPLPAGGLVAVLAYVWSAIPAALTGLAMAAIVYRKGTFDWLETAAAAVIAFAAAYTLAPFPHGGWLPWIALVAGLVGYAMRAILLRARIITP